ncbi:MAG: hypothetical protein AB7F61_18880, partial [Desulfobulbus sp.]
GGDHILQLFLHQFEQIAEFFLLFFFLAVPQVKIALDRRLERLFLFSISAWVNVVPVFLSYTGME